jgi:hypothetical protein
MTIGSQTTLIDLHKAPHVVRLGSPDRERAIALRPDRFVSIRREAEPMYWLT